MSGTSNVGQSSVYEAGDQRNYKDGEEPGQAERFHEGKVNSHKANDSKDERSIANRLAKQELEEDGNAKNLSEEDRLAQKDPLAPARLHGNEPSKGAKIDAEIQAEEEAELRKKGIK
ncbi:hypothetical protein P154DRAFT_625626 [Amniculicola lignicola CBS 123094]|uniref:Uncharacterized protein n=1 Tax=Amniculicola lignicola CBS 123094 TaxID=1392246 RepID=A0A6A5VWS9_9PLEO|nr:hypothetical protein P154DRAFT_625626 [Amniculicola lignicola CBS 123094]